MRAPRIAVSGVGLVSALGQTAPATFRALLAGQRGLAPLTLFEPGDVRAKLVAEVPGLVIADVAPQGQTEQFSRTDALAVAAAREAVAQARLPRGARVGVVLGGTTGGMFETEELLSSPDLARLAPERARDLVSYPLSASLARVAEAVGGASVTRSICSACSGGAIALVQAAAWLSRGEVDYVLAGGADGLCRLTLLGFNALGATDPAACRPFDRSRAGLNLGEGAAVLVLERDTSALERGVDVLAWLDGYAIGAEAHHITHPEPSGARASQLLRDAMARAGLNPTDVGYVNAHGTGTPQNDAMEARSLLDVFGADSSTWVSSSKAQLGHTLGAAGAIEAALTVLALAGGQVPPGVGLVEPELAGLRHVGAVGRTARLEAALSSSFGFGGMSCVLAFAEPQRPPPLVPSAPRIAVVAATELDAQAEPDKLLDAERSRRFDAGSALAALGAARLAAQGGAAAATGLVLGSAFGNVERAMAFLGRARERGPRLVPPAEFPHLVPSAPAGNASVYAGLTGPVFAVSALALSGEAAFAAACELIELGVAGRIVAGAVAPRDAIVERVLGPLLDPDGFGAASRGEGAGFVLVSELQRARASGRLLAEVLGRYTLQVTAKTGLVLAEPEPGRRSGVVLGVAGSELRAALATSAWGDLSRVDLASRHGYHEALGAVALATAATLVAEGQLERALVLSGTGQSVTATLLGSVAVED